MNNAPKVFISFSSADKKIAEKIYDRLKRNGIDCWICTKDIPPGADFQSCIVDAINNAQVVVLVFSSQANASAEIAKELSLASKKIVIPARIEDVLPQGSFQYQLSNRQFVDLFEDFDNKLEFISTQIKSVIAGGGSMSAGVINQPSPKSGNRNHIKSVAMFAGIVGLLTAGWLLVPKPTSDSSAAPAEIQNAQNAPANVVVNTPKSPIQEATSKSSNVSTQDRPTEKQPSSPDASARMALIGKWSGTYVCGQGATNVQFEVAENLNATFRFFGSAPAFGPFDGYIKGIVNVNGSTVTYRPLSKTIDGWTIRPSDGGRGWITIGFDATLNPINRTLNGHIDDSSCSAINLVKV